jgi:hypothetical protein
MDVVELHRSASEEFIRQVTAIHPDHLLTGETVQLSYGPGQASEYVYQLAADHLVHSWDLAVAGGQDPRMDPDGWRGHVRGVDVLRLRDGRVAKKLSYAKG